MLDQTSFNALGLSDATLMVIEWSPDGKDLTICLEHANGQMIRLVCSWAHERKIVLDTPARDASCPMTWDATLTPVGQEFRLHLDFASGGVIDLLCAGVSLGQQA